MPESEKPTLSTPLAPIQIDWNDPGKGRRLRVEYWKRHAKCRTTLIGHYGQHLNARAWTWPAARQPGLLKDFGRSTTSRPLACRMPPEAVAWLMRRFTQVV